mmetsp:Transcript_34456/g.60444  ORF Transcript_34456/g.60444 Transcript_34456/m.60444 type:complete len:967 (-) Transcript_34456:1807-4707(-)
MASAANFHNWVDLQRKLKQSKLRLDQEEEDKQQLLSRFKSLQASYAKRQLELRELICKAGRTKAIADDSVMGSHAVHIHGFLFYIKSHLDILSLLIEKILVFHPWLDLFVESLAFNFYEDLLEPESNHIEMLKMLQTLIKSECRRRPSSSDIFNENVCTLLGKILPLYSKLQPQRKFLVEVLRKPLLKIVYGDQRDLHIDLQSLYNKVKFSRDTLTGLPPMPKRKGKSAKFLSRIEPQEVDNLICLNDSEVMIGVIQLSELLIDRCKLILSEIYSKVEALPYGVRWICKVLNDVVGETSENAEAERSQLIGTFLFAKWWLPSIISADTNGLLQDCDVPPVIRKNLGLVSNVLKQIFRNSQLDGAQYDHINEFIREEAASMREYFAKVIDIPDYINEQCTASEISLTSVATASTEVSGLFDSSKMDISSHMEQSREMNLQTMLISITEVKGLVELVIACEASLIEQGHEELVQLAAAIKTAQQLDDLFVLSDLSKEFYLMMINSDFKEASQSPKKPTDKFIENVKEVTLDMLMDMDHLGQFCNQSKDSSLMDIVTFIINYPYLFETKRDKTERIPIQTSADYLKLNLNLLPSYYTANNFLKLYQELRDEQLEAYRSKFAATNLYRQTMLYGLEILSSNFKDCESECRVQEHFEKTKELLDFVKYTTIYVCIFHLKTPRKSRVQVTRQKECLHLRLEYMESLQPNHSLVRSPRSSFRPEVNHKAGHVSTIEEFIDEFSRLDPVTQCTESLDDPEKISRAFFQYITILREEVAKKFPKKTPEEHDKFTDDLESYILRKMFSEVYPSWASHDDANLHQKTLELDWLEPIHLDIPRGDPTMWNASLSALQRIDICMSPLDKLACLVEFITKTVNLLFLYSCKEVISADNSLPVIIFLLVKAQPTRIHSNINFITKFRHQRKLLADSGFCLSQIQSAIAFIEQADKSCLSITEEEYDTRVAEARRRHNLESN